MMTSGCSDFRHWETEAATDTIESKLEMRREVKMTWNPKIREHTGRTEVTPPGTERSGGAEPESMRVH